MQRNTFAAIVLVGTLMGPSAFAGQINALGQWVPTSTVEGRRGWTAAGPTEEPGIAAGTSRSGSEATIQAIRPIRPVHGLRYQINALGLQVPVQTNHP